MLLQGVGRTREIQTDREVLRVGVVTYTQDDPFINALTDKLKEDLKAMSTRRYESYSFC